MAAFAFLRSWWNGFTSNPEVGQQLDGPSGDRNESSVTLTDDRKMQVSTVFSCMRVISESIGMASLDVYRSTGPNKRELANDHPVARLLEEPNSFMTGQELREVIAMQLCGWGNAYGLLAKTNDGRPVELWPLSPSKMDVHRHGYEKVTYKYKPTGLPQVEYNSDKILHIKGFGGDGVMGLSPLSYGAQTLGISVAAEKYSASFFKHGGRPSGVMMIDKPLTPQQQKDVGDKYSGLALGEDNSNKLWVLPAFAKYQPIGISPEDSQLLLTRQFQVAEICRFFRVPLFLVMETSKDSSWGTGLEQQDLGFSKYTLGPYLTRIQSSMNRWLFTEKERKAGFFVEFNAESLLRMDSKAKSEFLAAMVNNGLMNRNEARAKLNMQPFKGGEIYTAQSALAPVDMLGELNKPDPVSEAVVKALETED